MVMNYLNFVVFTFFAAVLIFSLTAHVESSPYPKGRGGGGSRSGGSSYGGRSSYSGGGSYSRGSWSRGGRSGGSPSSSWGKSSGGYKSKSSGSYKPKSSGSVKSFAKKHWKKAAAFGAGAYIGYKAHKGFKKV